jgi:hypothetical protein
MLKGAAFDVFNSVRKGVNDDEIIRKLIIKSGSSEIVTKAFVDDLKNQFNKFIDPQNRSFLPSNLEIWNDFSFRPFSVKTYQINTLSFSISYGSEDLFKQINPLIDHLSLENNKNTSNNLEIYENNGVLFLRENSIIIEYFETQHIHFLKGALLKKITGLAYSIHEENWMASLHASAITDGKSAILFSAKPGNGKSTIAALMQTEGYSLLSDDFILIDNKSLEVCPIPLATSIKEGSLKVLSSYYSELKGLTSVKSPNNKNVYYLKPAYRESSSYPVKAIVFIKYSPEVPMILESPSLEESIQNLLAESWVNPNARNVKKFLNWAADMKFYRISYSSFPLVSEEIKRIFQS